MGASSIAIDDFARYLRAHGCTRAWLVAMGVIAVAAGALQWIALPAVNPDRDIPTSMETVGTVLGLLVAAGVAHLLPPEFPQHETTSSRDLRTDRAALMAVAALTCVVCSLVVIIIAPPELTLVTVLRTYALIIGVHLTGALLGGHTAGTVTSLVFVAAQSVEGMIPWALNLLFNPVNVDVTWVVSTVAWAVSFALFTARGTRPGA